MIRTWIIAVVCTVSGLALFPVTAKAQYNCYAPADGYCAYQNNGETEYPQGYSYYGQTNGGVGVVGNDTADGADGYGMQAMSTNGTGFGAYSGSGIAVNAQGGTIGVLAMSGTSTPPSVNAGVVGSGSGSSVYGVYGEGATDDGVHGVYDGSSGYNGVVGIATGEGGGVYGNTGSNTYNGVQGVNTGSGAGVNGTSTYGYGVYAQASNGGQGVYAISYGNYGYGVMSTAGYGGTGVYGTADEGTGVYGDVTGSGGTGVFGQSTDGAGVYGSDGDAGDGVVAYSSSGRGLSASTAGTADTSIAVYGDASGGGSSYAGYFTGNVNIELGCLQFNGTDYHGTCSSDQRLKKNIARVTNALDRLVQLRGVTFEWKNPEERGHARQTGAQTGFIAQEVETVFPKWVAEDKTGFKTLSIPPRELAALEVEAFRTLKNENDDLKKQLEAVKEDTADRLDRLENGANPPRAGFTYGNGGWGVAGLLLGLTIMSRHKQQTA